MDKEKIKDYTVYYNSNIKAAIKKIDEGVMIISVLRSMAFLFTQPIVFPLTKPCANLLTTSMW